MADYINPNTLDGVTKYSLPIAQRFVDAINEKAGDHSPAEIDRAVATSAIAAVAVLEARIYALEEAVGAREVPTEDEHGAEDFGMNGGGIKVFDPEDRPWEN